MAQIAFLTLYLGLVSGRQPVELRADPMVVALRMELDGKPVATLTAPPWRVTIDFGPGIEPQVLVAIGLDANGQEVGRTSQVINLPRPIAEAEIVLEHSAAGVPVGAEVRWRHLLGERPRRMTLTLDDKPLNLNQTRAALPRLDMATPHVLSTDLRFANGGARKEIVFGGTLPQSTASELTATAVMETGTVPASLDGCFASHGQPIRVQAIEKSEALVIMVRDPNPADSASALVPPAAHPSLLDQKATRDTAMLDTDTHEWLRPTSRPPSSFPTPATSEGSGAACSGSFSPHTG